MGECLQSSEAGVARRMSNAGRTNVGRGRLSGLGLAITLLMSLAAVSVAQAAPPVYNLTGTWTSGPLDSDGSRAEANGTQTVTQMDMTTGDFSGTSVVDGTSFALTGNENGSSVTFSQTEGSYASHDVIPALSILSDGNVGGNGSFEAGNFWMEVTSSSTTPTPVPNPTSTPLRASATQVLCNLEVALSNFTCTAQVGDASGQQPAKVPTGSVKFTATTGALAPTDTCTLTATPGWGSVSSCAVTYLPPMAGILTGTPAPVTAAYSGDTVFAASTGKPGAGAGISPTPTVSSVTTAPGGASTTVSCPAGAQSCPITVNLSVVQQGGQVSAARKVKPRTVTIGSTRVTLRAGQKRKLTVSLNAAGRKLLAGHRHLGALLTVTSSGKLIKTQKLQIKPLQKQGKRRG